MAGSTTDADGRSGNAVDNSHLTQAEALEALLYAGYVAELQPHFCLLLPKLQDFSCSRAAELSKYLSTCLSVAVLHHHSAASTANISVKKSSTESLVSNCAAGSLASSFTWAAHENSFTEPMHR